MLKKSEKWVIESDDQLLDVAISGSNNRAKISVSGMESNVEVDQYGDKEEQVDSKLIKKIDVVGKRYKRYLDVAQKFIGHSIHGAVVDMGSGRGTFAAEVSKLRDVKEVFAVEYSVNFAELIMPICFKRVNADVSKIRRCIGSFNFTKFDDNSIDYVVEGGAYHHSEQVKKTISETFRILKPGGWFIGVDRSHPDNITEIELNKFRNKELSERQKIMYDLPIDQAFTRADWGEHEYRECDWLHFFSSAGFESYLIRFRPYSWRRPGDFLKKLLFKFFGNYFIGKRIVGLPYIPWFKEPGRTLIICKKPEIK